MASRKHHKLFEELGILDQSPPFNPYETLGLDPNFANEILKERDGLATLRAAATALYRVLAKRYHPDVAGTGDEQRFHEITQANERIEDADKETLVRWSRKEEYADRSATKRIKDERQKLVQEFTELFQDNIELGNHPDHFSQLAWGQGLLLQRANLPYLLHPSESGGISIVRGHKEQEIMNQNALDLARFLSQYDSFGLEPGEIVGAYITSERASLVDQELHFIMDITDPIAHYRGRRKFIKVGTPDPDGFWTRSEDPLLIRTTVLDKKSAPQQSANQMIVFSDNDESPSWNLPFEVVGVLQNSKIFNRIRHRGNQDAQALESIQKRGSAYFKMAASPVHLLIEKESQYSPLLGGRGSLVLYDTDNRMPIITDISVLGLIGSNSRAS